MTRFVLFITMLICGCSTGQSVETRETSSSQTTTDASSKISNTASVENEEDANDQVPEALKQTENAEAREKTESMRTIDELLLFFPTRFPDGDWEPENLTFQDVWFEAEDGTKLHGWYIPHPQPRAVILFAHGNAGNLSHRAWLADALQQRMQVSVMMFDYRGYGRSEGTPTAEGILQDGRAASAMLAELAGVKESDLVLMGRSLGGAVVVPLAAEIEARGLILQNTFSSLKDVAAFHYPKLSWLVPPDKLNSAAVIPEFEGALLQSHGDADRVVQFESGKKLFEVANQPKQFVTIIGGDHNDAQSEEYYETLEEFIETLPEN